MFNRAMNMLLSVMKSKDPIILENILIYCCGCCCTRIEESIFVCWIPGGFATQVTQFWRKMIGTDLFVFSIVECC